MDKAAKHAYWKRRAVDAQKLAAQHFRSARHCMARNDRGSALIHQERAHAWASEARFYLGYEG